MNGRPDQAAARDAVRFESVGKRYGAVAALDDVSLSVARGGFTTILGPSGSGKTTMLSLIAGIVEPTSGRIFMAGRDVTSVAAAQRNVGLVFQSYALFPHMSVRDNVGFPLSVRRVARAEIVERVDGALRLVRMESLAGRRPSQLSGGQQQRVALARAIVFKPDLLLLDEPLAALDRKLREEVRVELRQLQRKLGITTILVTHDQDEALSLSDEILVLNEGRVQQVGAPEDTYHHPCNRFVADFLGTANFIEGTVRRDGGRAAIVLDSGEALACPPTVEAGTRVCGVLRPERIRLGEAATAGTALRGRIQEATFFGDSVRYVVTFGRDQSLTAYTSESHIVHPEGAEVGLAWDPNHVWILPRGERKGAGSDEA